VAVFGSRGFLLADCDDVGELLGDPDADVGDVETMTRVGEEENGDDE